MSGPQPLRLACWCGDRLVAPELRELRSFWGRGRGFMFAKRPEDGLGYLFRRCGSLHTAFMRFRLDVVYLDAEDRVVKIAPNVGPWRISLGGRSAKHAVEAPAGVMDLSAVEKGMRFEFRPLK